KVVRYSRGVEQLSAGGVMTTPFTIEPELLVSQLIDNVLPVHQQTAFLVAQDRKLHGVVTLIDLKKLPRERWHRVRVAEVMRPVTPEMFVFRDTLLRSALEQAKSNEVGMVAVLDPAGQIAGVVMDGRLRSK
ncbi:MAG: hypothetical protein ABIP75_10450, partial [Pyrinomonadaceae bacterium]